MKDKKDTTWHAIKQGFLTVFILIMIFLSLGFILFAVIFIALGDENEEYKWDDWYLMEKWKQEKGGKK